MAHDGKRATLTTPTDTQILITREFDAPRHEVYEAWITPELLRRWWHANRADVTEVVSDVRPGGRWRYAARADDGFEFAFFGEYREVVPDARLVCTEHYTGAPEAGTLNTATFSDVGGRTHLELTVECQTKADRDAQLGSGMEGGLQDALVLLEGVARELARA